MVNPVPHLGHHVTSRSHWSEANEQLQNEYFLKKSNIEPNTIVTISIPAIQYITGDLLWLQKKYQPQNWTKTIRLVSNVISMISMQKGNSRSLQMLCTICPTQPASHWEWTIFFKFVFIFNCVHCMCTGFHRLQKVPDLWELELLAAVSHLKWVLGTELRPSARAVLCS